MTALRRVRDDESGTTVVEFALVAPVLILILVCSLDFARALNAYVLVTNASRDGARYATVQSDPAVVHDYVARRLAPLSVDAGSIVVSTTCGTTTDPRWTMPGARPCSVSVEVVYPWQAVTWLAGTFISASGSRTLDVMSTMEAMR